MVLKLCDSEPLQIHAHSRLYCVWNMPTNICVDLCDPKRYRPGGASEVLRVGWCTFISVLDLHSFVLEDFLRHPGAETCRSLMPVIKCILLSNFFD